MRRALMQETNSEIAGQTLRGEHVWIDGEAVRTGATIHPVGAQLWPSEVGTLPSDAMLRGTPVQIQAVGVRSAAMSAAGT